MTDMTTVMQSGDATPHILRAYKATGPGQLFREVPVNSAQAGATALKADTLWQAVTDLGVHFRTFEDDGCGMLPTEMPVFLNNFGGSGKTIGLDDENFGVGVKTSVLPDNKYGVVVLSLRHGYMSMMWLWTDPVSGSIGARNIVNTAVLGDGYDEAHALSGSSDVLVLAVPDAIDPDGDHASDDSGRTKMGDSYVLELYDELYIDGIDWTKAMPHWVTDAGHGTCFVLLGNKPFNPDKDSPADFDTINFFGGTEAKYGMVNEINGRFWKFDLPVSIRGYNNFGDRTKWPTSAEEADRHRRQSSGTGIAGEWRTCSDLCTYLTTEANIVEKGSIEIDAGGLPATAHWYIFDPAAQSRGDRISHPMMGAIFESHPGIVEVMDLKTPSTGVIPRIKNFVGGAEVHRQLAILLEPKAGTIWQDSTRTKLYYHRNGIPTELPWSEWAEAFGEKMPDPIQKRIDAFYDSRRQSMPDGVSEEDRKRLGDKFGKWMRAAIDVWVLKTKGTPKLNPGAPGTVVNGKGNEDGPKPRSGVRSGAKPSKRAQSLARTAAGTENAVQTKQYGELPEAIWADPGSIADHCAMEYDEPNHKVLVNQEHFYVVTFRQAIREHYSGESKAVIEAAVKAADGTWLSSASLAVAHQLSLYKQYEGKVKREDLMSAEALTAAMAGCRNHLEVAYGPMGKAVGLKKRKNNAA